MSDTGFSLECPTLLKMKNAEIIRLRARIAELEQRLEIEPGAAIGPDSGDGIDCRNETIKIRDENDARLLGRIAELEAAQTWQPMETAPRDGTRCLIWDGGYVCELFYEVRARAPYWSDDGSIQLPDSQALAWMPLPKEPKA